MKSKELEKLYKSILNFASMDVDTDGYIVAGLGEGNMVPALVGKKNEPRLRLIMPTQANLRADQTGKILFHPLSEDAISDILPVTDLLRKNINIKLNYVISHIVQSLISLAASPELHKKLSPEQLEMIVMLKDVDTNTANSIISLMLKGLEESGGELMCVNLFVRRGGTYKGERYARVGVTTFNMYNELLKDPAEMFGVKLKAKDKNVAKAMFEYIFPGIKKPEQYNFGSNDKAAAWLHALMETAALIAGRLNDILTEYQDYIEGGDELLFNSDWVKSFDDLENYKEAIRNIPNQSKPAFTGVIVPEPTKPAYPLNLNNQAAPLNNRPYDPYVPQQRFQPPPPQQQPQQQSGLVYDEQGRLDFRSLMACDPNVARAANMYNQGGNMNQGYVAPRPYAGELNSRFNQPNNVYGNQRNFNPNV